jgi:hypothetical protein
MDGTFEAVENVDRTLSVDFKSQVVVVAADLATSHSNLLIDIVLLTRELSPRKPVSARQLRTASPARDW